jgi:hypothetical protein
VNYELAKKLKDAGFPQKTEFFYIDGSLVSERKETWLTIENEWGRCRELEEVECVAAPTLSELIEACGDRIKRLEKKRTLWHAVEADECCDDPQDQFGYCHTSGTTPEEAVGNLWIALHK